VTKANGALAKTIQNLANHNFDTSKYISMKTAVSRDAATGRLIDKKATTEADKPKRK